MKIAVCFSGEPRTWKQALPSIKAFFSGNHQFYYFGHVWANNTWGNHPAFPVPEVLDPVQLEQELRAELPFVKLHVEHHRPDPNFKDYEQYVFGPDEIMGKKKALNTTIPITWRSPFYSAMMSNHYKYSCEVTNDIHFDAVIRTRFDLCFTPGTTVDNYLPSVLQPHALYCSTSYFKMEYMLPAINDVFYFGSSDTMDIVDSFYRIYHNGEFFKMLGCDYFDGAYKTVGPGILLYKWLGMKNILPINTPFHQMPVIRMNALGLEWPKDFAQIMEAYTTW